MTRPARPLATSGQCEIEGMGSGSQLRCQTTRFTQSRGLPLPHPGGSRDAAANKRSVIPDCRHKTEGVAGKSHVADGRERQVSGHQFVAARRQLLQETDPDAS